jgi:hypothetical protein
MMGYEQSQHAIPGSPASPIATPAAAAVRASS